MNENMTVEQGEKHLARLQQDLQVRVDAIEKEIDQNTMYGRSITDLEKRKADLEALYGRTFEQVKATIREAKNREIEARREEEKRQAESDAQLRARLLKAWKNNGGDEKTFESAWPGLRANYFEQLTLRDALPSTNKNQIKITL